MNPEALRDNVDAFWRAFVGHSLPDFVFRIVFAIVVIHYAIKYAREVREWLSPADEKRRRRRRRRFGEHIVAEINRIDVAEDWNDNRFSELEAEVEVEGRRRRRMGFRRNGSLSRERSLSDALKKSRERLILLEGEPGSGKSVALRHLAITMASAARKSRSLHSLIPLYINLKSIDRGDRAIDAKLIREHVMKTLNRANSLDVEEFLSDEFKRGLEEGTWLFLFDSFDEIPDVLSATSADTAVSEYGDAIATFLTSMNECRGIVASRYFRGPGGLGWPRFRILALSDEYRRKLIHQADLPVHLRKHLIGRLEIAGPEIALASRNPMFLGLLCQYMRNGHPFPDHMHVVFERYIATRLENYEKRNLLQRFGISAEELREAAEQAAFCMAAHPTLGLSPARVTLAAAMAERGYGRNAEAMFNTLEFVKLARVEGTSIDATFTFSHRRFQEYFATAVVLDAPGVVTPEQLLTDARWRETAVVLLQTQTDERLAGILPTAEELLERECAVIDAVLPEFAGAEEAASGPRFVREFPWPPLALHLMSLLQSGFQGRPAAAPERLRELVGRIVEAATRTGTLRDRKWALEVAGISRDRVLVQVIGRAFTSGSRWLAEVAYRQAALLATVTPEIVSAIRGELIDLFVSGRLRRESDATFAHLRRLPRNQHFVRAARVLMWIVPVDLILHALVCLSVVIARPELVLDAVFFPAFSLAVTYVRRRRVWRLTTEPKGFFHLFWVISFRLLTMVLIIWVSPHLFDLALLTAFWPILAAWMAFVGILPVSRFIDPIRAVLRRLRELSFRQDILPVIGRLLVVGAMFAFVVWLAPHIERQKLLPVAREAAVDEDVVLCIMITALFAIFAITHFDDIHDALIWRWRIRSLRQVSDARDLVDLIRRLRTSDERAALIDCMLRQSAIDPSPGNETAIRELAVEFENWPVEIEQRVFELKKRPLRESWRDVLRWSVSLDKDRNPRVVDGLNILAERLRARRAV
ncbi:MAG TPA: NACHT domain-containing protein [Thermoanaerobaculia bacterium]|jgi:hypothetical protein